MQDILFLIFIFVAEVVHLTLATIRVVFVARGLKLPAAAIGFLEILVFLFALGQIMQNLTNVANYIAFASGFATGSIVGLWIEEKIAVGLLSVTIITEDDAQDLIEYLREQRFGVTSVTATGMRGMVRMMVILIKRKQLQKLQQVVQQYHPDAFMSVQDVRMVSKGFQNPSLGASINPIVHWRKKLKR